MKKFAAVFIFLLLVNIFVPFLYAKLYRRAEELRPPDSEEELSSEDTVTMTNIATGLEEEIPLEDFLIGAAACEMPASYNEEAIKAQMLAAYSYYLYCRRNPGEVREENLSFDEENMKRYASKIRLTGYWGTRFYDYYPKFEKCARRVMGQAVFYKGSPALTVYHAVSCGKTRPALERWGQDLAYLRGTDSRGDALSEDYLKIKEMSPEDVYGILMTNFPNLKISREGADEWFGQITYTESGYADFVQVGTDMIPADQFRDAFALPSSCLMVFLEDGTFSFVTKGYGHGVGMSQYGANDLARQGYDCREILRHYFPGTKIEKT